MAYIEFEDVCKAYKMGTIKTNALSGCSFKVEKGEFVVILGASGAGKSTILNILGGMDSLSYGTILVDGEEISKYNDKQLTVYRRNNIGFIFQFYNLMQNLTAKENVELALDISDNPMDADEVLEMVGLGDKKNSFPSQMSGGEQQRVAIARAIGKNPKVLLCDEPTGALDYNTGKRVLKVLQDLCFKRGMTTLIVTHNSALAAAANKVIHIKNGAVESVEINRNPMPAEQIEY